MREKIKSLKKTNVELHGCSIEITSEFNETMVDGKVCNALAFNKSTPRCYICNATSKEMNKLDAVQKKTCNLETFSWGFSTLHAFIKFMECLLHISYRLDIKTCQVLMPEHKISVNSRTKNIIKQIRKETGLLLDTTKQGG
ncbi:hypothetical protein AVEN_192029-1 [Araneus ventricosus]|uniref:Uncharacterized protein n=1 Tax=Araneus ventricosus TaxID=182803 RepID=A0A4Y2B767_ARAVE|nr:hypothetical protein AVEN_192029-1 [Araneus ventricosus]